MTYNQFVKAYRVLRKLSGMDFGIKDAYAIYKLSGEMEKTAQFGIKREEALMEKYGGEVMPDGDVNFVHGDSEDESKEGVENMQAFRNALNELGTTELDMDIHPITLSYEAFGEQRITPNEIADLEGVICFE